MNYKEAMTAIVEGDWVTHDKMQPGSYIAHTFADGPRINFASGSSSGWTAGDTDREAEWTVCGPEVERPKTTALFVQQFGRALRPVDPAVGWGNPLPPIIEATPITTKLRDRPLGLADNVGKWGKPPADLPPGHYDATLKVNANGKVEIDMVKLPAVKDKWGRLTNAPD